MIFGFDQNSIATTIIRGLLQDQNFIGGSFRPARDGATDDIVDPATGTVIGSAPSSGADDVADAVAAAAAAFDEWSMKTPRERSELMGKLTDRIEGAIGELSEMESRNVGKPVSIIEFEMDLTVDNWRFFERGRTVPRGQGGRGVHGGIHLDGPP